MDVTRLKADVTRVKVDVTCVTTFLLSVSPTLKLGQRIKDGGGAFDLVDGVFLLELGIPAY